MKKIVCIITLIAINICFCLSAEAIKIGLVENTNTVTIGSSNSAMLYDGYQNKFLVKIDGMKPYILKSTKNSIAIKIDNKFYDTKTNKVIVNPGANGFVSVKGK